MPYYDPAKVSRLIGIEPDPSMLAIARKRLAGFPIPIELIEGCAEALPLPDASVDTAVVTYALCTIPDPERALCEIRRILKPCGRLLFIEHERSTGTWLGRWQDRLNGVWGRIAGGCHLNRAPQRLIEDAGFVIGAREQERFPLYLWQLGIQSGGVALARRAGTSDVASQARRLKIMPQLNTAIQLKALPQPIHRYPVEMIDVVHLTNGRRILLRPVLPQDLELHGAFFDSLSKDSRYNRFFNPMPTISTGMLEHLTHIDHRSHVAIIAEIVSDGRETVIGEARFMVEASGQSAEFAIAVTDKFHKLGLGYLLLVRLLCAASRAGLRRLSGEALAVNEGMLRLARKAGFTLKSDPKFAYLMRLEKHLDGINQFSCTPTG